ncbi:MAG: ABC transporter substrate-binding protein [Microbacterium sp.]|jgi:multiple sugar transport system substrate-binding protein|uniref:ABC transporter substrate-binding protein n=1 Tax=Microbacterium sp. TaxID=51671 RepID=UPI00281F2799|nr:ABC transporter substrate-binding protein [Microbacterium sp.]MDR2321813.1 ABC transporter substrate-binding protein [Microbacterium sp.]
MNARRTRTTLGAGLLSVIVLLAGCSSAAPEKPSAARPEKVDLKVALWGGAERADLYQQVLDQFSASQKGVTATMEFADQAPYFERLTTGAASKNLPDLFWVTDTYFGRYADAGAFLDLTPYLGDQIDTKAIDKQWLSYGKYDKGTYALPSNFNGQAVLIDQVAFDARGVKYEAKSWDDLAALAKKISRPAEGYYGMTDPTVGTTQRAFEVWVRQHGQELYDKKGQLGFDQELLVDWWGYWAELRKAQAIPAPDVQLESETQGLTNDLLTKGKAAIRLSSATHLTAAGRLRNGGLTLQSYPEIKDAAKDWRFYTPLLLTAAANTPAPGVVAELMNTIINSEDAGAITKISMGTPTSTKVSESILPQLSEGDQKVISYLNEQLEFPSRASSVVPEASQEFTAELSRFSQEVAYGRMSPKDAAKALFGEAKRILR